MKNNESKDEERSVRSMGSVLTESATEKIYCMSIVGQIEGHTNLPADTKTTKYEHIIPTLAKIERDESIDGLLLILNTVGGDVEAGLALAEMLASMKTPVVSLVIGGGHSIGVPLAVSAAKSFIVPSATMTVHPVRMNGTVIGAPQTFNYISKLQERIIEFVSNHSKINADSLRGIMLETDEMANDVGTILFGEEAVNCGLIDEVGGLSQAFSALCGIINRKKSQK